MENENSIIITNKKYNRVIIPSHGRRVYEFYGNIIIIAIHTESYCFLSNIFSKN